MVSRVLDASAFYAGIPFRSQIDSYTTPEVYDEIKHIKKNHDALGILLETRRLTMIQPEKECTEIVIKMSKTTGDFNQLSKEDISSIALGLQLNGELITDDFAVSNVAQNLGLKVSSIMTLGIKYVGNWIHYCPGCHKNFSKSKECPICGNQLRKKLLKNKS